MNKKIISVFICLLLIGMIPLAVGMNNDDDKIETEASDGELMRMLVFGLFPQVSGNNITYMILPLFAWHTILKDKFTGRIGTFIILGSYDPSPF